MTQTYFSKEGVENVINEYNFNDLVKFVSIYKVLQKK